METLVANLTIYVYSVRLKSILKFQGNRVLSVHGSWETCWFLSVVINLQQGEGYFYGEVGSLSSGQESTREVGSLSRDQKGAREQVPKEQMKIKRFMLSFIWIVKRLGGGCGSKRVKASERVWTRECGREREWEWVGERISVLERKWEWEAVGVGWICTTPPPAQDMCTPQRLRHNWKISPNSRPFYSKFSRRKTSPAPFTPVMIVFLYQNLWEILFVPVS